MLESRHLGASAGSLKTYLSQSGPATAEPTSMRLSRHGWETEAELSENGEPWCVEWRGWEIKATGTSSARFSPSTFIWHRL